MYQGTFFPARPGSIRHRVETAVDWDRAFAVLEAIKWATVGADLPTVAEIASLVQDDNWQAAEGDPDVLAQAWALRRYLQEH
jgi:hypothetical protein